MVAAFNNLFHIQSKGVLLLIALTFLASTFSSAQNPDGARPDSEVCRTWEGAIDYPVDKTSLFPDFQDNGMALSRIDSLAASLDANVDSIIILGTASPEGNAQHNLELAQKRVLTFHNYLIDKYPLMDSALVHTSIRVFQWNELTATLRTDPDLPDSTAVFSILNSPGRTDYYKGIRLRTNHSGAYYYINEKYLNHLRRGSVIVYYRSAAPVLAVPEPVLPDTVCQDSTLSSENMETAQCDTVCHTPALPRRELISVKTNLPFDFAYVPGYDRWCPIPNIAIEYYPLHGHFTYGFSFDCPWWSHYDEHKYFQIRNYQLDTRYYLQPTNETAHIDGAAFKGLFFNAYAHAGLFSICFDADRGWMGEGAGAGVGIGYVLPISRNHHWRLEGAAQFGFVRCKYDPYQYESPVEPSEHDNLYYYKWTKDANLFRERMYRWTWLGPTRIAISLSTDLIFRKSQKEKK